MLAAADNLSVHTDRMISTDCSLPLVATSGPRDAPVRMLYLSPTCNTTANEARAKFLEPTLPPTLRVDYYNAPKDAPISINGVEDGETSTQAVMEDMRSIRSRINVDTIDEVLSNYHVIVVGCFSDHPLVSVLRQVIQDHRIQVVGLMEAALDQALLLGGTFGIVTTGLRKFGLSLRYGRILLSIRVDTPFR